MALGPPTIGRDLLSLQMELLRSKENRGNFLFNSVPLFVIKMFREILPPGILVAQAIFVSGHTALRRRSTEHCTQQREGEAKWFTIGPGIWAYEKNLRYTSAHAAAPRLTCEAFLGNRSRRGRVLRGGGRAGSMVHPHGWALDAAADLAGVR